jgi:hypothetical protein
MYIIINFALICLLDFFTIRPWQITQAFLPSCHTDKKENEFFLRFRWNQDLGKGFLIYEEMRKY